MAGVQIDNIGPGAADLGDNKKWCDETVSHALKHDWLQSS